MFKIIESNRPKKEYGTFFICTVKKKHLKRPLVAKLSLSFKTSKSVNLAMSEFYPKARK